MANDFLCKECGYTYSGSHACLVQLVETVKALEARIKELESRIVAIDG